MNTYLLLKSLHIFGVILFLGNIIVTGWWKTMADYTRNPAIIAFAQRQVTLTDYIFTAGGATIVAITGIVNATLHQMDYFTIKWLAWSYWSFIASGAIWIVILVPIQIKQAKMAKQFSSDGNIPDSYWKLSKLWLIFGIIATVLPFTNLYWMVFKSV